MKGQTESAHELKSTQKKRGRPKKRQEKENTFEFTGEEAADAKKVAAERSSLTRKTKRSIFTAGVSTGELHEGPPAPKRPRPMARASNTSIPLKTNHIKPTTPKVFPTTRKSKQSLKITRLSPPADTGSTVPQPSHNKSYSNLNEPVLVPNSSPISNRRCAARNGEASRQVTSTEKPVSNSSASNMCLPTSASPIMPTRLPKLLSQNPAQARSSHEANQVEREEVTDRADENIRNSVSLLIDRSRGQQNNTSLSSIAKKPSLSDLSAQRSNQTDSEVAVPFAEVSQTSCVLSQERPSESFANDNSVEKRIGSNLVTLEEEKEVLKDDAEPIATDLVVTLKAGSDNVRVSETLSPSILSKDLDPSIEDTNQKHYASDSLSPVYGKQSCVPEDDTSKIDIKVSLSVSQNTQTVLSEANFPMTSITSKNDVVVSQKSGKSSLSASGKVSNLYEPDKKQTEPTKASQLIMLLESLKSENEEEVEHPGSGGIAEATENDLDARVSPQSSEEQHLLSAPAANAELCGTGSCLPIMKNSASSTTLQFKVSPNDSSILPDLEVDESNTLNGSACSKLSGDGQTATVPLASVKSTLPNKQTVTLGYEYVSEKDQIKPGPSLPSRKAPVAAAPTAPSEAHDAKKLETSKTSMLLTPNSEKDTELGRSSGEMLGGTKEMAESPPPTTELSLKCDNVPVQSVPDRKRKILQSSNNSKRVRFTEPSQPLRTSGRNVRLLQLMRRRQQRCLRKVSDDKYQDVSVAAANMSGLDQRHLQLHLDELQYLLDGVFKHDITNKAGIKLVMTSLHALVRLFLRISGRRANRDVPFSDVLLGENTDPVECSPQQSDIIDLLVAQPQLFSKIVKQLCTTLGKSRSVDALIALLLVIIFRSAGSTLLVSQLELDLLLTVYLRTCATCFSKDGDSGHTREVVAKRERGKKQIASEKRGMFAMRSDKFEGQRQPIDVLNELIAAAGLIEEDMSNHGGHVFSREVHATAYLLGTGLAIILSAIPDLRIWMRGNRRLDIVVAIVYSSEEFAKRRDSHESSKPASHRMGWRVSIGSAMRVLQYAAYDEVCQLRIATETRVVAIAVDVLRRVNNIRIGCGLDGEWVVCNALKLCINLMRGSDADSSSQFVKVNGLNVVLDCLTSECAASKLLDRGRGSPGIRNNENDQGEKTGKSFSNEISFDVRVLCLALLASAVNGDMKACMDFPFLKPSFIKDDDSGALSIALEILARSSDERNNGAETELLFSRDHSSEKKEQKAKSACGSDEKENPVNSMERKITIGYVCLLLGALVRRSSENRMLLTQRLSKDGLLRIAEVLLEFLEFHHEVGVVSASVDEMYQSIITALQSDSDVVTTTPNVSIPNTSRVDNPIVEQWGDLLGVSQDLNIAESGANSSRTTCPGQASE